MIRILVKPKSSPLRGSVRAALKADAFKTLALNHPAISWLFLFFSVRPILSDKEGAQYTGTWAFRHVFQ
jgi:hypothetical protein